MLPHRQNGCSTATRKPTVVGSTLGDRSTPPLRLHSQFHADGGERVRDAAASGLAADPSTPGDGLVASQTRRRTTRPASVRRTITRATTSQMRLRVMVEVRSLGRHQHGRRTRHSLGSEVVSQADRRAEHGQPGRRAESATSSALCLAERSARSPWLCARPDRPSRKQRVGPSPRCRRSAAPGPDSSSAGSIRRLVLSQRDLPGHVTSGGGAPDPVVDGRSGF